MINNNELLIDNKSYINKDFASIYPELLDLVKSLTETWDPQTTNESDPGIVLLKALAFVGDKLNYNVDKNVLECFMPSATQESSMRKLCSVLGYDMKYYRSAVTTVKFVYTGNELGDESDNLSFTLPALKTVLTSDDKSVNFTLIDPVTIRKKYEVYTGNAIQGKLETLTAGDGDIIQLTNIDDNNRIYLPISNVAENGIFINADKEGTYDANTNPTAWHRVDNLNTQDVGSKVFKFSFDSSRGLPYIEFPEYIADVIGDGLTIQYIITSGINGNIKANLLTVLSSPTTDIPVKNLDGTEIKTISFDEEGNNDLAISNVSASINGSNPEGIDEAYNAFKKTIGTFDTLVTCRDYANGIYNMSKTSEGDVVSNVQVSDRRDDINFSKRVLSFDQNGIKMINTLDPDNPEITAFDLCLYPLNPITSYELSSFLNSFKPSSNISYIEDSLEAPDSYKTLSHNFKNTQEIGLLYLIKNYYKLNARISTTHKVNAYEERSILENVNKALIENFNARKVDYGYEIPYDTLLQVIEEADPRISIVNLDEPKLTTKFMFGNGSEFDLSEETGLNKFLDIVAKNIVEGKISLFDYNNKFEYDFGQEDCAVYDNIAHIETEAEITLSANTNYTLNKNEAIQLIAPSLITENTYTYGVWYCFEDTTSGYSTISDKTNAKLNANQILWIYYTDSKTKEKVVEKLTDIIIQPTGFDLKETADPSVLGKKEISFTYDGQSYTKQFCMLQANEEINRRKINESTISNPIYACWIRNNASNELFNQNETETILGEGEYFFYTKDFNDMVSLGSGTKISLSDSSILPSGKTNWSLLPKISYADVLDKGILELQTRWVYLPLSENDSKTVTLTENSILTLTENDIIKLSVSKTLNNTLQPLADGVVIKYTIEGETEKTLENYANIGAGWSIRSRLDLNCGPNLNQTILSGHSIIFVDKNGVTHPGSGEPAFTDFRTNELLQLSGSDFIDVRSYDLESKQFVYPLSAYTFEKSSAASSTSFDRDDSGFINISFKNPINPLDQADASKVQSVTYTIPNIVSDDTESGDENYCVLMLYWIPDDKSSGKLSISGDNCDISYYNESENVSILRDGINNIKISNIQSDSSITIEIDDPEEFGDVYEGLLRVSKLSYINGINKNLNIPESSESDLLAKVAALSNGKFYYTNPIDNSKAIELTGFENGLADPLAYYDYNNIANKFTLSEIDFGNSNIIIVRSSKL